MAKKAKTGMVTGGEKASYGLYFLGQNIFYMLIYMYMNTYFTDVGIKAGAVAIVALVVKVWDAVNDPIFGGLMDKVHFKKGKFVPWLKISLIGIPIATILLFAIPTGIPQAAKIAWAIVAYMLWDTAYTICDVPIFGLVTTVTNIQEERTSMNAIGRICAMIAAIAVMVVIPSFRSMLGGWTSTVIMLSVVGAITMIPICFAAKERVVPDPEEAQPDYGVKDMFKYLKTNKYLFIYYLAFLVQGALNVTSVWGLYIARECLHDESIQTITGLLAVVPMIVLGAFVPAITKKIDKFKFFYIMTIASCILGVVKYFVGYSNVTLFLVFTIICCLPAGFTSILMYMFTPDCAEYGQYATGNSMPGITFATQTFFAKLQSAVVSSVGAALLVAIGFIEGEGAVQAAGFADKLWMLSCWMPVAGFVLQLIILKFYKLNDHDVQLMAKVNAGEMDRAEADSQMINKY